MRHRVNEKPPLVPFKVESCCAEMQHPPHKPSSSLWLTRHAALYNVQLPSGEPLKSGSFFNLFRRKPTGGERPGKWGDARQSGERT